MCVYTHIYIYMYIYVQNLNAGSWHKNASMPSGFHNVKWSDASGRSKICFIAISIDIASQKHLFTAISIDIAIQKAFVHTYINWYDYEKTNLNSLGSCVGMATPTDGSQSEIPFGIPTVIAMFSQCLGKVGGVYM